MSLSITPADASLGATIENINLTTLDSKEWTEIEQAFLEYAVLVFRNQHLNPDEQTAFAKRFGDIELLTPNKSLKTIHLSNINSDGSIQHCIRGFPGLLPMVFQSLPVQVALPGPF